MKLRPKIKILASLSFALLLLSLYGWQLVWPDHGSGQRPSAAQGTLDLRAWDFERSGNVRLDGEWAFIPHRLVGFDEWPQYETEAFWLDVPKAWSADMDTQPQHAVTTGTYRLRVLLPAPADSGATTTYAYRAQRILDSHSVLVASPAADGETLRFAVKQPRNVPYLFNIHVSGDSLDMIVQISNTVYQGSGGITLPIAFGLASDVYADDKLQAGADLVLAVIALLHALTAAVLYVSQRSQKHLLYFALLHLFASLYVLSAGERLLLQALPEISNETGYRLTQIGAYGLLYYCHKFIHSLYPQFLHPALRRAVSLVTIPGVLLAAFLDVQWLSSIAPLRMLVYVLAVSCIGYVVIRAVFAYKDDAPYLLITAAAMLSVGIPDILIVFNIPLEPVPPIDRATFLISLMLLAVRRFVDTSRRVNQLSIQNEQMKSALLQAQIKPHFLFNSLNTIGSLIETDPTRAQDLLADFSNYLRYSFDLTSTRPLIAFEREWAMVEAYLTLEQARYEDSLQVRSDVSAAAGCMLPPLTLQPLVENAVRHGLMRRDTGGWVSIRATRSNGFIDIEVADNGVGMPGELIAIAGRRPLRHEELSEQSGAGIGLYNIHQRLVSGYGEGLTITSRDDGGTAVSFRIPSEAREAATYANMLAD